MYTRSVRCGQQIILNLEVLVLGFALRDLNSMSLLPIDIFKTSAFAYYVVITNLSLGTLGYRNNKKI